MQDLSGTRHKDTYAISKVTLGRGEGVQLPLGGGGREREL